MDCRYSLKPYASSRSPHLKWAVTGPGIDGDRRWRKLFETRTQAETFLYEKQNRSGETAAEDAEVPASERSTVETAPPPSDGEKTKHRTRKRSREKRIGKRHIVAVIAGLTIGAFFTDRALRDRPAGIDQDVVLAESFATDPLRSGWTASAEGTDWAPAGKRSNDRAIMFQSGAWTSPSLKTEPLAWYRIAFKSKAPGTGAVSGGTGLGECSVVYSDAAGAPLGTDVSPILHSQEWRWNELRVRAQPIVDAGGKLRPAMMKVVFSSKANPCHVDDLKIEKVTVREVTGWADATYGALPARLQYRPKESRWTGIPNALEKLRKGLPLRIVVLGDGVQQELANAPFDALLRRHFANSEIEVLASTKPGADVTYFREHIPEKVNRLRPDLLIIGGIRNGGDLHTLQEIVDNVRAGDVASGRETDIMVITRPWSPNVSPRDPGAFFLKPSFHELDQRTTDDVLIPDDDRGQLLRFAQANRVEFFDMAGIVSEFIFGPAKAAGYGPPTAPTGAPYSFWMRDSMFPNLAGRQIMARILAQYFVPERTGTLPRDGVDLTVEETALLK